MSHLAHRARPWRVALATTALVASVGAAPVTAQDASPALVAPDCGTEPVELLAYFETGFPIAQELRIFSRVPPPIRSGTM